MNKKYIMIAAGLGLAFWYFKKTQVTAPAQSTSTSDAGGYFAH